MPRTTYDEAEPARPPGISFLIGFFLFGAAMCSLTVGMLAFPGGWTETLWRINPEAQRGFTAMGSWAFVLLVVVGGACVSAAIGLARRAEWGRRVALAVLFANVAGDLVGAAVRQDPRTLIGLPIAGAMIAYLCSRKVKAWLRAA